MSLARGALPVGALAWRAARVVAPAYSLGITRLQAGGTRWVSGPQLLEGHSRFSRAVALALGTGLGRGGSRKWARQGAPGAPVEAEYELDSGVFTGV
jgi:hypothetical protein